MEGVIKRRSLDRAPGLLLISHTDSLPSHHKVLQLVSGISSLALNTAARVQVPPVASSRSAASIFSFLPSRVPAALPSLEPAPPQTIAYLFITS